MLYTVCYFPGLINYFWSTYLRHSSRNVSTVLLVCSSAQNLQFQTDYWHCSCNDKFVLLECWFVANIIMIFSGLQFSFLWMSWCITCLKSALCANIKINGYNYFVTEVWIDLARDVKPRSIASDRCVGSKRVKQPAVRRRAELPVSKPFHRRPTCLMHSDAAHKPSCQLLSQTERWWHAVCGWLYVFLRMQTIVVWSTRVDVCRK